MTAGPTRISIWGKGLSGAALYFVEWLTEPSSRIEPKARRSVQLVSAFLLLMTLNTAAGVVIQRALGISLWPVMLATSLALFGGYLVSRSHYIKAAIICAIALPSIPPLAVIFMEPLDMNITAELMWLAMPLMVASLMLAVRSTVVLTISFLVLIIIFGLNGMMELNLVAPVISFLTIITFFVITITYIRRKDQSAIESQLSDRLRTEKILRESEEKYKNLFLYAKDTIMVADVETGIIIDVNPAGCALLGLPKEKIIGLHQSKIHPPDLVKEYKQLFREHVQKGLIITESIIIQRAYGSQIECDLSASVIMLGGRQVIQGVFRDISERKRMERAMANEVTRRRILIEQSRDGIVVLDENGKVYEANRRFAEMLGYNPEEVTNLHVWDWDTQWSHEQLLEMIRTVTDEGDHFETYHQRKDGTIFEVEISTNGATFMGQKLVFCVCRDITERKQMEKALKESEAKFSLAFHSSPQMITITNLKTDKFVDVNESFLRTTGYSREDFFNHPASQSRFYVNQEEEQEIQTREEFSTVSLRCE
jgi:PAS domain S-box-containing protein